jgi:hypothetical protein
MAASVVAVWIGARMQRHGGADNAWQFFLEQLCFAAGLNLIAQALLAYVFVFSLSSALTMSGCVAAVFLLTLARAWTERHRVASDRGVLLAGYDPMRAKSSPRCSCRFSDTSVTLKKARLASNVWAV